MTWEAGQRGLLLWGEQGSSNSDSEFYPHAVSHQDLRADLAPWEVSADDVSLSLLVPSINGTPLLSPRLQKAEENEYREATLTSVRYPALFLDPIQALLFLSSSPSEVSPNVEFDDSVAFWREVTKLLLDMLTRGRYVPNTIRDGANFYGRWLPVFTAKIDSERLRILTGCVPRICLSTDVADRAYVTPRALLESFLFTCCDALIRTFLRRVPVDEAINAARSVSVKQWVQALFSHEALVQAPLHELIRLEERLKSWARPLLAPTAQEPLRAGFRLHVPPATESAAPELWTLELLLCAESDSQRNISASRLWNGELGFLEHSDYLQEDLENILLKDLGAALATFPLLRSALEGTYPASVKLPTTDVYDFLKECVPELETLGYPIFLPSWWRKPTAKVGLKLSIDSDEVGIRARSHEPFLATGQLLDFSWQVALGERDLSREEFEELVKQKMPLIRVQGQWVELDPRRAEATLAFLRQQEQRKKIGFLEALHLGFAVEETEGILPLVQMSTRGWVQKLLSAQSSELEILDCPPDFQGELRPYQREGLSWLAFRMQLGIGGCLADDMGLGKTIQLLALLLFDRTRETQAGSEAHRPFLLVVPMSILANWEAEIRKFAPTLRFYVHHGAGRWAHEAFYAQMNSVDIVITTYSLVFRDEEILSAVEWGGIALDEAQNIKNLETKQTKAVRRLCHTQLHMARRVRPFHRIALTGTPLENHLQELWSIFDFLNPGLLGEINEFRSRFAVPIERYRNREAAASLSRLLRPFVLRRLKSDPQVISDLPEKIEMQELIPLTNEQAGLYQAALDEMMPQVEAARGIHRKGLVLSTITRLKQICNHPSLFLKDGAELSGRSHKLTRLEELLEEIIAEGDKALIFTQFAQFGHLLQPFLQNRLHEEVIFLHGALPRAAREKIVNRFQQPNGPKIFILSLRAGGFGLNLTEANQVIHVDQWWNPAVEDQATDRAYRIGQKRNVQVRKLVCKGTLEERIAEMLRQKRELADQIVGATKDSITQLSTDELRKLLELSPISGSSMSLSEAEDL